MVWFYNLNFSVSAFHFYCPCRQFSFAVLHSLQLTRIGVKDHFQVCRTILLPYTVYHTDRLKKKQRIKGALGPLLLPFEAVFMQQLQNIKTDRGREGRLSHFVETDQMKSGPIGDRYAMHIIHTRSCVKGKAVEMDGFRFQNQ